MDILITGGCGFVGHHFVEHFLLHTDWNIIVLDRLNYAGTLDRLRDIGRFDDKRILVLTADFSHPIPDGIMREVKDVRYILHLGAESHVDRSIDQPRPFVTSNVMGTVNVLEMARRLDIERFYYFSTDEVFGPAPEGVWYEENDAHNPSNPYSASKSAGEMFCKAYRNTYDLPVTITRSMNIFGERQHPEKFVAKVIRKLLRGETVQIHAVDGKPGSRFWVHARNIADGYLYMLQNEIDEDCHITAAEEVDNLTMAEWIAQSAGLALKHELVPPDRPGHDLRYALSGERLATLGWKQPINTRVSLDKTVRWYMDNQGWLDV